MSYERSHKIVNLLRKIKEDFFRLVDLRTQGTPTIMNFSEGRRGEGAKHFCFALLEQHEMLKHVGLKEVSMENSNKVLDDLGVVCLELADSCFENQGSISSKVFHNDLQNYGFQTLFRSKQLIEVAQENTTIVAKGFDHIDGDALRFHHSRFHFLHCSIMIKSLRDLMKMNIVHRNLMLQMNQATNILLHPLEDLP
ncbi:unnamed protein product [Cuscuta europaea]|uniref:Uncharacterized protein n=1 Tax=Cuscuta europaea TaxID=41803 RepID=A0A9P0YGR1_CUSEU|nr:unnamed protein product [Cuscuta europaea]